MLSYFKITHFIAVVGEILPGMGTGKKEFVYTSSFAAAACFIHNYA